MKTRELGVKLSKQQQEAVDYIGAALVIAGAGSGKTRTLTSKIAHLIDMGYPSEQILAITFTNKAADEMKDRLLSLTGLPQERFPWVRTYHSACYKILKKHCETIGYRIPLQIYADYQQQKLLKNILLKFNIDKKYLYSIASHISGAKNSGNPEAYFEKHSRLSYIRLHDIYNEYEKELFGKNAVDFDNILLKTRNLLRDNESIRNYYHSIFKYILIDEYQDTNDLQEELTRLLTGNGNLFCVGDDWQAIYGFRGSNVNHFLDFSNKYRNSKIFRLERNYRSAGEIVQTANQLISNNPKQMEKKCFSTKNGGSVEVHSFFDDDEEAQWVASRIAMLKNDGFQFEDMAILYRTKFCSLPFEQTFRSLGIPYKLLGAKGFFERKEILDLTSYLTSAAFIKDDAAFERIINTPKRGIGPSTIKKFYQMTADKMSLQEVVRGAVSDSILSAKHYSSLKDLVDLMDKVRNVDPETGLNEIIRKTNYLGYIKEYSQSDADYTTRVENIEQLVYSASHHDSLLDFLEEASLIKEDKQEGDDAESSGVNLSTIHASKGLEFKAVFIVGCEENLLPHWKSKETISEIYEERRLMYVGMTRAETMLFVTSASYRKGQYNPQSRFVSEIC